MLLCCSFEFDLWCGFWSLCSQLGQDPLGAAGGVLARLVGDVGRSRPHHPAGSSLQRPSPHQLVERRPAVPDRKHPCLHGCPEPEGWEQDKDHVYQNSSYMTLKPELVLQQQSDSFLVLGSAAVTPGTVSKEVELDSVWTQSGFGLCEYVKTKSPSSRLCGQKSSEVDSRHDLTKAAFNRNFKYHILFLFVLTRLQQQNLLKIFTTYNNTHLSIRPEVSVHVHSVLGQNHRRTSRLDSQEEKSLKCFGSICLSNWNCSRYSEHQRVLDIHLYQCNDVNKC